MPLSDPFHSCLVSFLTQPRTTRSGTGAAISANVCRPELASQHLCKYHVEWGGEGAPVILDLEGRNRGFPEETG